MYANSLLIKCFKDKYNLESNRSENWRVDISPIFIDACWELCRCGILRPFTYTTSDQGTTQGDGFSITAFGRQWLDEGRFDNYVPTEPDRFADILSKYVEIFGKSIDERAQEAVRCYNAHAYLACCVMVGAASETILNAVADRLDIQKPESQTITKTRRSTISNTSKGVRERVLAFSYIIELWIISCIQHDRLDNSPDRGYISLALLLRLASFRRDEWFRGVWRIRIGSLAFANVIRRSRTRPSFPDD